MAEEVKMEPVAGVEPPKPANPLVAKPTITGSLKPGLRLPPKQGSTVSLKPGLKLPPKPGAIVTALKPGLKLPPKPGATVTALKSGLKLPPKPVIRKPGSTITAKPLPKPVAEAPKPVVEAPKPVAEAPKPVVVDQQGVGKLPTVEANSVPREASEVPPMPELPKPLEQLKSVTQKLKGLTQSIPQQAILHKTGIVADSALGAMSDAQKEAQKHKTARISLSDALGAASVKTTNAPMKTIRIKRPIDIPTATKPMPAQPRPTATATAPVAPATPAAPTASTAPAVDTESPTKIAEKSPTDTQSSTTITQRKTLKITRPGVVRPGGKFGMKRPTATASTPVAPAVGEGASQPSGEAPVADIADIPDMPASTPFSAPTALTVAEDNSPAWLSTLSSLVQAAACLAMGLLAWYLYTNTQTLYF